MIFLDIIGTIINHPSFFPLEKDQPFVMSFHDAIRPKATFTINKIGDSLIRGKTVFNRNYTRGAFSRDKKLKSYPKCDDILRSENLLFVNFYRSFSFGTMEVDDTCGKIFDTASARCILFFFHMFEDGMYI